MVNLEIPDDHITTALKEVGFNVESVVRVTNKDCSIPTRTIKVTFSDYQIEMHLSTLDSKWILCISQQKQQHITQTLFNASSA